MGAVDGRRIRAEIRAAAATTSAPIRSSLPGAALTIRHLVEVDGEGRTVVDIVVSIDGPLARLWKRVVGPGIAESTPTGLRRLVEVVEADAATTGTAAEVDR